MGGSKRVAVVERRVNPLGAVITIDPENAFSAPKPGGTSSIAPHPVTGLIIVPAQSAAADPSSKVHQKVKFSVEVPHSKPALNRTKTEVNSYSVLKNRSLEKIVETKINEINVLGENKILGKNNSNKDKRKTTKKDKRNNDSIEINLKTEPSDKMIEKPYVSDLELPTVADESNENNATKTIEKNLFDKKNNSKKTNEQTKQLEEYIKAEDKLDPPVNIISYHTYISNSLDSISNDSKSLSKTQCTTDKADFLDPDSWSVELSDQLKTNSSLDENAFDGNEILNQRNIFDTVVEEKCVESENLNVTHCAISEKDNVAAKMSSSNMNKSKRKCKTLGRKIKTTEGSEKPIKPHTKLDEVDLLDSQPTKDSVLNDIPDLVLSNSNILDITASKEEKTDVSGSEIHDNEASIINDCANEDLLTSTGFKEEKVCDIEKLCAIKTQNDETTDKDSSDEAQNITLKGELKSENLLKQKKKKSNRKQKENEKEMQSDSDTNFDKRLPTSEEVSKDTFENIEKSIPVEEVKPKMSWSRIVAMGKQDANGNFSNANCTGQSENDSVTVPSTSGNDERDTAVKTNSTEDRGSVYESCSESVGEEAQFEIAQQESEIQEMVFDSHDKTNSDNENLIETDCVNQNVDDDSIEKSNTDSGERDSGDANRSSSKKSRKQRKKKR